MIATAVLAVATMAFAQKTGLLGHLDAGCAGGGAAAPAGGARLAARRVAAVAAAAAA